MASKQEAQAAERTLRSGSTAVRTVTRAVKKVTLDVTRPFRPDTLIGFHTAAQVSISGYLAAVTPTRRSLAPPMRKSLLQGKTPSR